MRTIKFRVWDKANNIFMNSPFVGGHPLFMLNNKFELGYVQDSFDGQPDYEYTFQQFTGIVDRNGNDIYEGDILQHMHGIGEIVFSPFSMGFVIDSNGRAAFDDKHGQYWSFLSDNRETYTVIGNIAEHKHLLT